MQITPHVWQVGGQGLTADEDGAVYLVCLDGRAAIVDAGCGGNSEPLAANIAACEVAPEQIDHLLLTHCHFDHTGGAEALRSRYGCPITAHALDVEALEQGDDRRTAAAWYGRSMLPLAIDRVLTGAENPISLGSQTLRAIHTPGHTPGSIVFLLEADGQRVLFGQDVHGPLHDDFDSDRDLYRQSLQRMADLDADILCEGHYGVIRGREPVRAFIHSFL